MKTLNEKVVKYSLAYLSVQKWLVEDDPLNANFVFSEPPIFAAAVRISDITKCDEYSICNAMIRVQYEITNNVH